MIASMDLNASPRPKENVVFPKSQLGKDDLPEEQAEFNEQSKTTIRISHWKRNERMRRWRPDAGQAYEYQVKPQIPNYNQLPPGWLNCPAYGHEIGFLIPSKVPLGESFNDSIVLGRKYSFRQVIHQHSVLGRKLGLVIDLTNSSRYYNLNELREHGIKHVKIACKGRDVVPENEAVNKFVFEVSQFLAWQQRQQRQPKKYVLVHCTHGYNRTGYMIVHYLMRTICVSVTEAVKMFADARPPGIYKPSYIGALYSFYHEKKPDIVICPSIPEWKRLSDLDPNGDTMIDDDGASVAHLDESDEAQLVMTNDDILGDKIPSHQEIAMQQFCYRALKLRGKVRGSQQFPGSHPVSLNSDNLQLLRQYYYHVTWKADGTRYMMLITRDGCYLIDRHFSFQRVQMRFPCRHANEKAVTEKICHHFTLLDGEMVIDIMPNSQKQVRTYLIYDMMAINQVSIVEGPFYERWEMIEKEVIEPRRFEEQIYQIQNSCYKYDWEPFRVRRKDFWPLSTVAKLLKVSIPKLSHAADGLIFQGRDDPYVPRTHEGLLKWKYAEMNSVDFLFEVVDNNQLLYLFERGEKRLMDNKVVFPDRVDPSAYSGKIIECCRSSKEDGWMCMRVRTDKRTPNEYRTYERVMRSIKDNITEDILLKKINEIICLPMYVDKIQNEGRALQPGEEPGLSIGGEGDT